MEKKKRAKKSKIYFTKDTENAIVKYNETEDAFERELIFRNDLEKPFNKMCESIVNRWPFDYLKESDAIVDIKNQVLSYLVSNLGKYSQEKGKAFSYFSVIAKNWLILHNNNMWKERKRTVYFSETNDSDLSIEEVFQLKVPSEGEKDDIQEFMTLLINYWDTNIPLMFKKARDEKIAYAILQLMKDAKNIEVFNKKALYMMIRDMTDTKTNYITKVITKMRKKIAQQWTNYNEHGMLEHDELDTFFQ